MIGADMEQMCLDIVSDKTKLIADNLCLEIKEILSNSKLRYDLTKVVSTKISETADYHTVQLFEKSIIHVKGKKELNLELCPSLAKLLEAEGLPLSYSSNSWGKIKVSDFPGFQSFPKAVEALYEAYLKDSDPFGCCSHYMECSDAKDCIKEDIMFAGRCAYRQNLRAGRIFYGKNKNI